MKTLFILLFFFTKTTDDVDISYLRNLYLLAAKDEVSARQLIEMTKNDLNNAVVKGYYGAGKMLMAKYYINPVSKWNSFKKGKETLETAIQLDPDNPELRYLRLSVQNNSPSFLGYNENIEQDKLFLNSRLPAITDKELHSIIMNYLKTI